MQGASSELSLMLRDVMRLNARHRSLQDEADAALAALAVLSQPGSVEQRAAGLLKVLRSALACEDALIVVEGGAMGVGLNGPTSCPWPLPKVVSLCASGPMAVYQRSRLPELADLPVSGESLLLLTLAGAERPGLLVLSHSDVGFFGAAHARLIARMAPLLAACVDSPVVANHVTRLARYPGMNPRPVLEVQWTGRVVYMNAASRALLGAVDVLPDVWRAAVHSAQHAHEPVSIDVPYGHQTYDVVVVRATAETAIVYAVDVTERVEVERSATAANARLSTLIASLHMGILVEDDRRMVVLANEGLTSLFHIPVPHYALVGTSCAKSAAQSAPLFVAEATFERDVERIVAARERVVGEVLELKDGRVVERDYVPVTLDGRPAGHMWLYRDVTAVHQQRRELEEAKRIAEESSQAKSDFLAGMSHEIRTPLNAILGMSELLTATDLSHDQQAWLASIRNNGEALLDVITDVLDLSKIEAGELSIEPDEFSVRGWLESIVESLSHRAHAKGLGVRVYLDPDLPDRVVADAARLRQVLVNLIGNAVRFTDVGEVTIRVTGRIQPKQGLVLRADVRDTGVGISEAGQAVIFEKYGQADGALRGGTGLGLHITKRILGEMGGDIRVRSVVGQGSQFTVRLPVTVADASPPEHLMRLRATAAGLRVAILASPGNRAILMDALAGAPLELVSSRDAQVCLTGGTIKPPRGPVPLVLASPVGVPVNPTAAQAATRRVYAHFAQERLLEALVEAVGRRVPAAEGVVEPTLVRPWRVLLAEDNVANQVVATGLLEAAGHEVVVAGDGARAVALAGQGDWDVILMDVDMPIVDGMEATRRIRNMEQQLGQRSVPIVALTAHATPSVREAALDSGMDGFEVKPIRRSALLRTLDRVVRSAARVLVVDDAADIRRFFQAILEVQGRLTVRACASGSQAVLELSTWPADLVLMDVEMPGMSGLEAVGVMRQNGFAGRVVAVTGHDDVEAHRAFLRAGYDDVMVKPIRSEQLLDAVRDWLRPEPEAGTPVAAPQRIVISRDLRELIPEYLDDLDASVERLFMAMKAEDWDGLRRIGHQLKGSGGSYGFPRISDFGAELERNAGHVPVEVVAATIRKLHRHVNAIYEEMGGRPPPKTFDERDQ